MKRARKLGSLLLALVMVFALATTAFAAETGTTTTTGTITVDNPVAGRTYTAYKIFDVVYDTSGHYSYTIDSKANEWYGTVSAYASVPAHGLQLTQVNGGDTYVVTTGDGFSAPDFAATLKENVSDKTGNVLIANANGSSVTVDKLPLGYYFVASASGALCNLTTTNPEVTIHDKNDMPFEKVADKTNADVGQIVTYTITGKVPDYTGFDTYIYTIEDTMSAGLTFDRDSLSVEVGNTDVTADTNKCKITYDVTTDPNTFKVSIIVKNCTVGDPIEVTYKATVNEKAIAVISNNKAKLTYSNDPTNSTKTTTTPPQEQKVYTSKIVIDKFETGKQETVKLPDAKFVLYKKVPEASGEVTKYYKQDETTKAVTWVDSITNATEVTTDNNGAASFDGLADGTYYLVETKAPAGYNQLTEAKDVEVKGSITEPTKLSVTAEVENKTGTTLPSTGGMGTTIFYVLGSVLVIGAAVLLVTKKRMSTKG